MLKLKWLAVLVLVFSLAQPVSPVIFRRLWVFGGLFRSSGSIRPGANEIPMGKAPTGYILFLPEGRMAVIITGEGRTAPTTDQDRAVFTTPWSHIRAGTAWTATSGSPRWTFPRIPPGLARNRHALFKIDGNRLQEMTAWMARPDNRMARALITYERAK